MNTIVKYSYAVSGSESINFDLENENDNEL